MKGPSHKLRTLTVLLLAILVFVGTSIIISPNKKALALPGNIVMCSTSSAGSQSNGESVDPSINYDGRYVVFASDADNLVPGDNNLSRDVFRKDLLTNAIALCSCSANGTIGNAASGEAKISGDGRFVVFSSGANNLVEGDNDGKTDVFRKDLATNQVVLCSARPDGSLLGGKQPAVNSDGRYVVFTTSRLSEDGTTNVDEVFRKDLANGNLVSCSTSSSEVANLPSNPTISADGSRVAFVNHYAHSGSIAYLMDLKTGVLSQLAGPGPGSVMEVALSGDGVYLGLTAVRSLPDPRNPNITLPIPAPYRMNLQTGEIAPCFLDANGNDPGNSAGSISISNDGRYLAFTSVPLTIPPGVSSVFRKDMLTGDIAEATRSTTGEGPNASSHVTAISGDGRFVAFSTSATNLAPNDLNLADDIFRKELPAELAVPAAPADFTHVSYFAEGYTGPGFQEYLTLGNGDISPAAVQIVFFLNGGQWLEQDVIVPAGSRQTLDVNSVVGSGKEVSIRIASDKWIGAERPMYFDYFGLTGGHVVTGAAAPSRTWFFAEGYTGPGFDEYVCVLNEGEAASLTFRFQTEEEGEKVIPGVVIAAHARATYRVNDLLGTGFQNALKLESSSPVVAERSLYFDYGGWTGGSCTMGATAIGQDYYFSEGTTREGFHEYLTLQNPGSAPVVVNAYFILGEQQGGAINKSYSVEPGKRTTIFVPTEVPSGKDVSVHLSSTSPFLAERPLYFSFSWLGLTATGGSSIIGAFQPVKSWYFTEGCTIDRFIEFITIQNPNAADANVEITYFVQGFGPLIPRRAVIKAGTRATITVNTDAGPGAQLSCRLDSDLPIVAERPMYFDYNGWDGGHDALGVVP